MVLFGFINDSQLVLFKIYLYCKCKNILIRICHGRKKCDGLNMNPTEKTSITLKNVVTLS